jgi:hypothetical protein
MTESEWQQQVLAAALRLGWQTMHIGRTGKHQAVGAKGTLGIGWPDVTLVKGGRIIFAELKAQDGVLTPNQNGVFQHLSKTSAECYIWRPSDFGLVLDTLAV